MGWPGPTTYRQYAAWQAWLAAEWNNPGRLEHYIMQLTAEAARSTRKRPSSVTSGQFRINFKLRRQNSRSSYTPEERTQFSKTKWLAVGGGPAKVIDGRTLAAEAVLSQEGAEREGG